MADSDKRIGFVGLGAMGSAMAAQLLKAGYVVRGYDVRADNRPRLEAEGGTWAVTPAAAAAEATLLIVMVATAEQADTALFGPGGAVGGLAPGATVILSATVAPDDARAYGAAP